MPPPGRTDRALWITGREALEPATQGRNVVVLFTWAASVYCMHAAPEFGKRSRLSKRSPTDVVAVGTDDLEAAAKTPEVERRGISYRLPFLADRAPAFKDRTRRFDDLRGRSAHGVFWSTHSSGKRPVPADPADQFLDVSSARRGGADQSVAQCDGDDGAADSVGVPRAI